MISDAARRAADVLNEAHHADMAGNWVAIRLSDGGSDGKIYEYRADAVRFQFHETQCMYLMVQPMMSSAEDMEHLLRRHREMYAAGYRMVDPQEASAR